MRRVFLDFLVLLLLTLCAAGCAGPTSTAIAPAATSTPERPTPTPTADGQVVVVTATPETADGKLVVTPTLAPTATPDAIAEMMGEIASVTGINRWYFLGLSGEDWANSLPMNVVKEFMGHADIATTAKFYNKVDDEHRRKAKEAMNNLLEVKQENDNAETTDVKLTFSGDDGSKQVKKSSKNSDFGPESQYPRCDSNAQPLAPEANALSN